MSDKQEKPEDTLVIIKPDGIKKKLISTVLKKYEEYDNLEIVGINKLGYLI